MHLTMSLLVMPSPLLRAAIVSGTKMCRICTLARCLCVGLEGSLHGASAQVRPFHPAFVRQLQVAPCINQHIRPRFAGHLEPLDI